MVERGKREAIEAIQKAITHVGAPVDKGHNQAGVSPEQDERPKELRVVSLPGEGGERDILGAIPSVPTWQTTQSWCRPSTVSPTSTRLLSSCYRNPRRMNHTLSKSGSSEPPDPSGMPSGRRPLAEMGLWRECRGNLS